MVLVDLEEDAEEKDARKDLSLDLWSLIFCFS